MISQGFINISWDNGLTRVWRQAIMHRYASFGIDELNHVQMYSLFFTTDRL